MKVSYTQSAMFFLMRVFREWFGQLRMKKANYSPSCVDLEIKEVPESLFQENLTFVQVYPLFIRGEQTEFGASLLFEPISKTDLMSVGETSDVLDLDFIKSVAGNSDPKTFFQRNYLRLCGLDEKWEALQLVIYLERTTQPDKDGEKPVKTNLPIRITRFLIPPFFTHPGTFEEQKGLGLLALHPHLGQESRSLSDIEPLCH